MTARELSRDQLQRLDRPLLADHSVVAIIPTTDDQWAVECAWDIARAAARKGRRVALIDLFVESPTLDQAAPWTPEEGIVDAFLFGASLSHVAQRQEQPGLHFVGVGSSPGNADEIWGNARWERLARGFAQEGALLLVFIPPEALDQLALNPDGLIVVSPQGYYPERDAIPPIARRLEQGVPLTAVVADPVTTASLRVSQSRISGGYRDLPAVPADSQPTLLMDDRDRGTISPVLRRVLAFTLPMIILGTLVTLWALQNRTRNLGSLPGGPAVTPPVIVPPEPVARETPEPSADSLFYSVQVAAFSTVKRAMDYAAEFERYDLVPTVTPVRIGNQGVWHRVILGLMPNSRAADSVMQELRSSGRVERSQGAILRTPQALDLGTHTDPDAAQQEAEGLRAAGIPAYIVRAPGGTVRILVGAFEAPEQAGVAESLLAEAGIAAALTLRTGILP